MSGVRAIWLLYGVTAHAEKTSSIVDLGAQCWVLFGREAPGMARVILNPFILTHGDNLLQPIFWVISTSLVPSLTPIPKLLLTQYAAEAAASSAPLSFGSSPLVPGHASNFPSPCPPSPMPFALPSPVLSPPLVTPSPRALKLVPPSSSSPFAFIMLPSFPHLLVSPITSNNYMVRPSPAMLALASLRCVPPKNFKLAPPLAKLAAPTGRILRSSRSTPAPPPVAGPSKPRKRPLVPSSVDEDSANKRARLTLLPHLTAAQKGKGHAPSLARITTKQGRSLAVTKDVRKVMVKGGLGEKTPEDAVEVEDPALMLLGLLVPDKDYGDFIGWWSRAMLAALPERNAGLFTPAQENVLGVPFISTPACFMESAWSTRLAKSLFLTLHLFKIFVLVLLKPSRSPFALPITRARVKEWKDLVDVDAEVAFETEGEDEDEDEDESS
ncbi:hypothetical protein IW261DRAFT_1566280 [Armillaria novae-zelandiae]|uniref:Uncharacterized protein n=1 Tax=Armillaria novae-zelandiae TaxID=153914 RepID=A0AA39UG25_9AGAR|nr:hypothetical protein IW261DRAFT_1566280 [Armillaria novae-zelandiae]